MSSVSFGPAVERSGALFEKRLDKDAGGAVFQFCGREERGAFCKKDVCEDQYAACKSGGALFDKFLVSLSQ